MRFTSDSHRERNRQEFPANAACPYQKTDEEREEREREEKDGRRTGEKPASVSGLIRALADDSMTG